MIRVIRVCEKRGTKIFRHASREICAACLLDAGLGLIDAALGRKEEALREGWRAVELLPVEKDKLQGTRVVVCLAMIAAWIGDNNLACEQLARAIPWWDPLRGDPRFEKIVASLAPKSE